MYLSTKVREMALLRLLQIKGVALISQIPAVAAPAGDTPLACLERLKADGLVEAMPRGYRLTEQGRTMVNEATATERTSLAKQECVTLYDDFDGLNGTFKRLVYDWQIAGDPQRPNDHQDAAYDTAIRQRLAALHPETLVLVARAEKLIPRLALFRERFAASHAAFQAGDDRLLTSPMLDSYHTAWFELHEELIALAGRTRAEEARHGRAD